MSMLPSTACIRCCEEALAAVMLGRVITNAPSRPSLRLVPRIFDPSPNLPGGRNAWNFCYAMPFVHMVADDMATRSPNSMHGMSTELPRRHEVWGRLQIISCVSARDGAIESTNALNTLKDKHTNQLFKIFRPWRDCLAPSCHSVRCLPIGKTCDPRRLGVCQ